jgi:hypothetical protein
MSRSLYDIARDVRRDWRNVSMSKAEPYLKLMEKMRSIEDIGAVDAVREFLANTNGWRRHPMTGQGSLARKIKKELRRLLAKDLGRWLYQRQRTKWKMI